MSILMKRLDEYGADVEGAMARFLNDEELYESCFVSFLEDEAFLQLNEALKCGDYERAFDAAHTLKGVAGNMGLTPMYCAVCAIVEPLREKKGSDLMVLHAGIVEQHEVLRRLRD
ncbi:MAG: Hpt domain-containing protein [Gordonibacter sp.]|nr:Hpt domain-containing protein [Gordonibacter sp.]